MQYRIKNNGEHGIRNTCRACYSKAKKGWYNKPETKERIIEKSLKRHLRKTYDLSLEEYNEMSESQNHLCHICNETNPDSSRRLYVDHNHSTGKIRKLLCVRCNAAIGYVRERLDILEKIIEYLRDHK